MTGTEYADILRDARLFSGGAPQYDWVCAWKTVRGIPLAAAAEEAALAAGRDGLLPIWLHSLARAFDGRYTIRAAEFAHAAVDAAQDLRRSGAVLLPDAVHEARNALTFAAWSAAAYAGIVREDVLMHERVFLPWLCAMRVRYVQE